MPFFSFNVITEFITALFTIITFIVTNITLYYIVVKTPFTLTNTAFIM